MTRKMFTNEVISHLKERAKYLREIDKSKNMSSIEELKKKLPVRLYLSEDCGLLTSGGLKRGHILTLGEAILLREYGFYIIWVTDIPISEDDKKKDIVYYYKTEMESILTKFMLVIDEKLQGRKPGSSISYIERNDLLRQTIEPLQLDGARLISKHIFGETGKGFDSLSQIFSILLNKDLGKVGLFEQNCLGNLWLVKQRKSSDAKGSKERVRSNFVLRSMLNIALSFLATIKKIQVARENAGKNTSGDKSLIKREQYNKSELIEASLSALFAEYGYLHQSIDLLILRLTNPYYTEEGMLDGLGFTFLDDGDKLVLDKHSNVSNYIFSSMKEKGFVQSGIAKDILRNHHRYLDGTGYPKRKILDERVSSQDADGSFSVHKRKIFDTNILETTRLVGLISFFVDALSHTPLHIPFQRDSLVRHIVMNSVYNKLNNGDFDKDGRYDFKTQYKHEKKFDAYLVDNFLSSIAIYKIGEEVPIYNFNNSNLKLYDAVVIKYNNLPHRPVISVLLGDNDEDKGKEIDLSLPENDFLYIGEYIPALLFQDVIDKFYLDDFQSGIDIDWVDNGVGDNLMESDSFVNTAASNEDSPIKAEREESVPDNVKPVSNEEVLSKDYSKGTVSSGMSEDGKGSLSSLFIVRPSSIMPYGLGEFIGDVDGVRTYKISYMAQCVSETDNSYIYKYAKLDKGDEQLVKIVEGSIPRFVVKGSYSKLPDTIKFPKELLLDSYYILYYNPAKDTRNRGGSSFEEGKTTAKYIVCIKEIGETKLTVQFIRFISIKGSVREYVKDKNCGKSFDILKFPFFELGELLSSGEIISFLGLPIL